MRPAFHGPRAPKSFATKHTSPIRQMSASTQAERASLDGCYEMFRSKWNIVCGVGSSNSASEYELRKRYVREWVKYLTFIITKNLARDTKK